MRALLVAALCLLPLTSQLPAQAGDPGPDPAAASAAAVVERESTPDSTPEPTPEPAPERTSAPEPTPKPAPEPTPEPTRGQASDPEPAADPTPGPSPTPQGLAAPTASPGPTLPTGSDLSPEPSSDADPTRAPVATPGATAEPAPSDEPGASGEPGASPGADHAEQAPDASPLPSASPAPSPAPAAGSPSLRTDLLDYAPGSLVLVLGDGWAADEALELDINDDLGRTWRLQDTVTADVDGRFRYELRLPDRFVATYTVVATGAVSGVATWRFDDSIGTGPRTTGTNGNPATSEVTIATPTTVAGRLLLATIVVDGISTGQVICTPGGWTSIGRTAVNNFIATQSFYRVATSAEPASTTWRFRSSAAACSGSTGTVNAGAVGGITAYAGVDTASPVVSWAGATRNGTYVDAPSIAGAPANATVVRAYGNANDTPVSVAAASSTGVAAGVAWSAVRLAGSLDPAAASADADQATAGATGTLRASNGSAGGRWAAQTIVLRMVDGEPVVALTIGDATAQLGSTLTPDGVPSGSTDSVTALVDGSGVSTGACYAWGGSVTVSSNAPYDLTVEAAAGNSRLDFLAAMPAAHASCTSGEPVGSTMFASATPAGAWLTNQSASAGRTHGYWLGLEVRWTDDPSAGLGAATLTFEAIVDW